MKFPVEMNLHVPQSLQTHHEIMSLAAVPLHIISPRHAKPIVSIVQDVALGVYRITQAGVTVSKKQLMNLMSSNPMYRDLDSPAITKGSLDQEWTGRQVMSTIIPKGLDVQLKNRDLQDLGCAPEDYQVSIADGKLLTGVLSTKGYDEVSRGLVHAIYNDRGPQELTTFLNNTQKLICDWLVLSGFSVGISDLATTPEVQKQLRDKVRDMKVAVYQKLHDVQTGKFENASTKSNDMYFESQVSSLLNKGHKELQKIGMSCFESRSNRMLNMIHGGSKGGAINFTQMVACVGQQTIDSARVSDGFENRTLPHFTKFDDGPESRGFVENSFIAGLTPQEFFFHSMGGRTGLIDTAVKSVTGDTPIVIIEGGVSKRVLIGEWIDAKLDAPGAKEKTKVYGPEEKNMELLDLAQVQDGQVYIPTTDEDGNVTWGELTAVTRHDPGERLYKVVTDSGREVTVAESNSLLIWQADTQKFVATESDKVRVGDCVPVTAKLPAPPVLATHIDVSDYLSKTDHVFGSDFVKARAMMAAAQGDKFHIPRGWWEQHNGAEFTLPYPSKARFQRAIVRSDGDLIKEGIVYPFHATRQHSEMPERLVIDIVEDGHGDDEDENDDDMTIYSNDDDAFLPDRFELDFDNGVFVGIYLADGHACEKSGQVGITKNDPDVRAWVARWFEKFNMKHRTQDNSNEMGTSITISGYSTLLARFMDRFVGHGSRNKYVPSVAFVSSEEFIRGILSGYFSGDGSIGSNSIASSSASKRLSEGIAMLCTRLGAVAKVSTYQQQKNNLGTVDIAPSYRVNVHAHWALILRGKLELIMPEKEDKLKTMKCMDMSNYGVLNDVIIDPIAYIDVINATEEKLYDVTVPSTLNFCIANGLHGRDTSETGYIQRKLVKSMEDCKVHYDLSVRNAAGHIVQFLYGDDGMDPVKLEYQHLHTVNMDPIRILETHYIANPELELKALVRDEVIQDLTKRADELRARMDAHHENLIKDKRYLICNVHGREQNDLVVFPVHFGRILDNVSAQFKRYGFHVASDLNPLDVFDVMEELCKEMVVAGPRRQVQQKDHGQEHCRFMPMLIRCFLSPKLLLVKYRLNKLAFERVVQLVRAAYHKALAQPGDMVGIVAAQSIGEPTTQMSMCGRCTIRICQSKDLMTSYAGPIGSYIDAILERHADRIVDLGGNHMVLDLEPDMEDLCIVGVSNEEKTSWRRISQVSRHPANGGMVRILTRSGKTTCATLSHSFLRRTEDGIEPVLGSDIKIGNRVPVAKLVSTVENPLHTMRVGTQDVSLTYDFGWLCGAYIADGSIIFGGLQISKVIPEYQDNLRRIARDIFDVDVISEYLENRGSTLLNGVDMSAYESCCNKIYHGALGTFMLDNFNTGSHNKRVPGWVYVSNNEFIYGLLRGYFDGDGNATDLVGKQMIRSGSVAEQLTEDIIVLLTNAGIFASKCKEKYKRNDGSTRILHTAQISRKYARRFKEAIGFVVKSKAEALDNIIAYVEREDKHSSKEEIDMIPELGEVIAFVGKALELPGQSRLYRRFLNKEAIGRETLKSYLQVFEASAQEQRAATEAFDSSTRQHITDLKRYHDETLPSANARGIIPLAQNIGDIIANVGSALFPSSGYSQYRKLKVIGAKTLARFVDEFKPALSERVAKAFERIASVEPKLAILRQAAYSDVVWDEIVELEYLPDPQEYVYDFTVPGNDSFMVDCGVLVHNTLNSVHYDTELLLRKDGRALERVTIGDFVENHVASVKDTDRLEQHPNDTYLGWLKTPPATPGGPFPEGAAKSSYEILSCDEDGRITWREVEAVTKHPVVNKDGTDTLLKVETRSGREVIATKAKSFLMRRNNKIVEVDGESIKVGDYLPVSKILPIGDNNDDEMTHWTFDKYLPKTEFTYSTEVAKALAFSKTKRTWFQGHNGKDFTVPHARSDIFLVSTRLSKYEPGCVYPKKQTKTTSTVPEAIPLDSDFGFFIGAYLAEGCCCSSDGRPSSDDYHHHCLVSNVDPAYQDRVKRLCKAWGCNWHMDERVEENGWHTATVRIHSVVMATLMTRACGNGAPNKRFPSELLAGPMEFLKGVLDGYFSGDGTVGITRGTISAASVSRGLLEDMRQLLLRFDVVSTLYHQPPPRQEHHRQGYNLVISTQNVDRFAKNVSFTLEAKQKLMDDGASRCRMFYYSQHDVINATLRTGDEMLHRDNVPARVALADNDNDRMVLQSILEESVMYDEIVAITEVSNVGRSHVYDLTVQGTRNFNLWNGLCCRDTFHLSGVANKGMQGVPRLKELMSVSKNIKTPCMDIHLNRPHATSLESAKQIASELQTTRFRDLVTRSRIYFDPDDDASIVTDDRELLKFYAQFREVDASSTTTTTSSSPSNLSPWVLRFEFDRAKMLDMNVTMLDLEFVLNDWYDDMVSGTFSDDNAKTLVGRLRLRQLSDDDGGGDEQQQDMLTELKALEQSILDKVVIKGIAGIARAAPDPQNAALLYYDDATDAFTTREEVRVETSGSNLIKVLAHEKVHASKTITNDVCEVYDVLGIEAARLSLFSELQSVMCMDNKNNVNYRHLALLVDVMTNRGTLQSIDRHGINRGEIGPLAKCSFEETTDMLVKAGMFAELDRINGVSANIMLGQVAPCGTGECEILIDSDKLERHAVPVDLQHMSVAPVDESPSSITTTQNNNNNFIAPSADNSVKERVEDVIELV